MTQTLKELLIMPGGFYFFALGHIIGFFSIMQTEEFDNFVKNV